MIKEYSPHEEEEQPNSSELQEMVSRRRLRLSQTIDQLGQELTPARLIERSLDETTHVALEKLSHTANDVLSSAAKEVKRNPWPFLLIGAGLALWLAASKTDDETADPSPESKY